MMRIARLTLTAVLAVTIITSGLYGTPPDLEALFADLPTRTEPPSQRVVDALTEVGGDGLRYLYDSFDTIDHMARSWYCQKVVPTLPAADAGPILLDEFRKGLLILDKVVELMRREQQGEKKHLLESAFAPLEVPFYRWRWTVKAIGYLGDKEHYDEIYAVYRKMTWFQEPHYEIVRALHRLNPGRAIRDFTTVLQKGDDTSRWQGIASFRQIGTPPACDVLEPLIDDPHEGVRTNARQLVYQLDSVCLDLLIRLSGHDADDVRRAAEWKLQELAGLPFPAVEQVMQDAATPTDRSRVWRAWWERDRTLTADQRKAEGLEVALQLAQANLDRDLVRFLVGFPHDSRIYPVLERALEQADPTLAKEARDVVHRLAVTGHAEAVQLVLQYCTDKPLDRTIAFVTTLGKARSPEATMLLLKMLEQDFGTNYTWPRQILTALGDTGDARAVEPVLQWMLEKKDGSEHYAAKTLSRLQGVEAIVPRLLDLLIHEPDHNARAVLRTAIAEIGGQDLPPALTRVLPDADAGTTSFEGAQKDVLLLMEAFPDPAAKPLLLRLLRSDNRFSHLYATRALAKLGDCSGVPLLLEDLFTEHPVPFHFYAHDIGQALKDVGAPKTRERLERLYRQVENDDRERVVQVIRQQEDPGFLPFLTDLIDHSGDYQEVVGAGACIAQLIHAVSSKQRRQELEITRLRLDATRLALRWAFHGEPMRSGDPAFPDHTILSAKKGAVIKVGQYRYLLYLNEVDSLRELSSDDANDAQLLNEVRMHPRGDYAYGSVHWSEYEGFMNLGLNIDAGGSSYLFRWKDGRWEAICYTGGWIS